MNVSDAPEDTQEELIEMINNFDAKTEFLALPIHQFWSKRQKDYPTLSDLVLRRLLPFPTLYLWESAFSQLLVILSKHRNKLNIEDDFRCAISIIIPRIKSLAEKIYAQPLH